LGENERAIADVKGKVEPEKTENWKNKCGECLLTGMGGGGKISRKKQTLRRINKGGLHGVRGK